MTMNVLTANVKLSSSRPLMTFTWRHSVLGVVDKIPCNFSFLQRTFFTYLKTGPSGYRKLNGIFCVYKPDSLRLPKLIKKIKENLAKDLNALPCYKYEIKMAAQALKAGNQITSGPVSVNPLEKSSSTSLVPLSEISDTLSPSTSLEPVSENTHDMRPTTSLEPVSVNSHDMMPTTSLVPAGARSELSVHIDTASRSITIPPEMELSEDELLNHRLVLGNRYLPEDIHLMVLDGLNKYSSGVLVFGVGKKAYSQIMQMRQNLVQVHHVVGRLGWVSDDCSSRGRIIERTTFDHVEKSVIDRVCAAVQANHQKLMFEYAGVHPESQEAYELARRGLLRPEMKNKQSLIYRIQCIELDSPHFTLEIHSVNGKCEFLTNLIHQMGLMMKSSAVCSSIRRVRCGYFSTYHALLYDDWHLKPITRNISLCRKTMLEYNAQPNKVIGSLQRKKIARPRKTSKREKRLQDKVKNLLSEKIEALGEKSETCK